MILFTGGNLGVLFLSGSFIPINLPRIARNGITSRSLVFTLTGKTWGV
jgi:hypothetical protein